MTRTLAFPAPRPLSSHSRKLAAFWRERPHEVVMGGVLALAGLVVLAGSASSTPTLEGLPGAQRAAPPAPPPLIVRRLAPQDALAINATIPLDDGPNPAARPFTLAGADDATGLRALECLASAVYYEAGNESAEGQRAVAQVVLNRVRHPAFPASVCGVVYQGSTRPTGCQFTFTCDGSLARRPGVEGWRRAQEVARAALAGFVHKQVGNATHYHANYVVPYWAPTLTKNAVVGAHIFYRWAGGWGRPMAFTQRYARAEANVAALRSAALLAEQAEQELKANQPEEAEALADIPGAEDLQLTPSMRGDQRVAIRFNLAARKAADSAPREAYVEKVAASENLRWSLTGDMVAADEKPLGRKDPTTADKPASPSKREPSPPAVGGGAAE
ncbi:MAG TPA: cell wall hydrolase [Sphingomicrobium sp.]|nr:cell wall hydrolase [Sphingomicrobium sp.]